MYTTISMVETRYKAVAWGQVIRHVSTHVVYFQLLLYYTNVYKMDKQEFYFIVDSSPYLWGLIVFIAYLLISKCQF